MGGGGQQVGYPSRARLPPVGGITPLIGLPFLTTWLGCRWRQVSASGPPSVREWSAEESRDQCGGGWENAISSFTLQLMVISRNLFHKTRVQKPSSTLLQCQSLPTYFLRAVRSNYPAYIVFAFIYKQGGGGYSFSVGVATFYRQHLCRGQWKTRSKPATTAHIEQ